MVAKISEDAAMERPQHGVEVPTSQERRIVFPRGCDVDEVLRQNGFDPDAIVKNPAHVSADEAAARFGLTADDFRRLVKDRIFPSPVFTLPKGEGWWDRKALLRFMEEATIKRPLGSGSIYFARMGDFIKIGFSNWPPSRIASMQTGSPYRIELLAHLPGTLEDEGRMHKRFERIRVRTEGCGNEWFKRTRGLEIFIRWLCHLHKVKPNMMPRGAAP